MRSASLVACLAAACSLSNGQDPGEGSPESHLQQTLDATIMASRIVPKSANARVLELVAGDGHVAATYYPGFFNASQQVPDPDRGELVTRTVAGTWFLGSALDARSGRVAVAVRAFIYAETSFDLVYLIDTRSASFAADPYGGEAFTALPFDGRRNDGVLPTEGVRPWLDLVPDTVRFDEAGMLHLAAADASGATSEVSYAPDLRVDTCAWHYSESPARCPDPTTR